MANINNYVEYAQVFGTNDADNIDNFAQGAGVYAFGGDDLIRDFYASNSTVQGYEGNDTIYNFSEKSLLDGGNDNDYFGNSASNVTILGGAGNDTVMSDKNLVLVNIIGDEDNDVVTNFSNWTTVDGGNCDDSLTNYYAANVVMTGGNAKDTLMNYGENVTLNGGADEDYISNYSSNVTIHGGENSDSIYSAANLIYIGINGGSGNDSIRNYSNWSTLTGGEGNDSLTNHGLNVTVDAGAGNDHIHNDANNVTIVYRKNEGNDVIHNFGENVNVYLPNALFDDVFKVTENELIFSSSSSLYFSTSIEDSNADMIYTFGNGSQYVYDSLSGGLISTSAKYLSSQ